MVLAFAECLGTPASRIVVVGDSLHDLSAARAAGAVGVAVLSGPAERAALEPHADHVIAHIGDLPEFLAELEAACVSPCGRMSATARATRVASCGHLAIGECSVCPAPEVLGLDGLR